VVARKLARFLCLTHRPCHHRHENCSKHTSL
jgi:hypothetical protein